MSLSTKFTLTIYWNVREKKETKKGKIILAPGDRFRVTVDKETFVSDGETYWQYSAGTNQLVVKRLADVDRGALPSQIFARYLLAYPFSVVERKKGCTRFAWKSDSAGTPYKEIRVEVQEKTRRITRSVLTDNNGNTFTYDFTSTAFGENYPKGRFVFDVPKNARIVDMWQ
jgi:outer membrane lipoprotein-sorting protein